MTFSRECMKKILLGFIKEKLQIDSNAIPLEHAFDDYVSKLEKPAGHLQVQSPEQNIKAPEKSTAIQVQATLSNLQKNTQGIFSTRGRQTWAAAHLYCRCNISQARAFSRQNVDPLHNKETDQIHTSRLQMQIRRTEWKNDGTYQQCQ